MAHSIALFVIAIASTVHTSAAANCNFRISSLHLQSPVPVRNGAFLSPTTAGYINIREGETLELYCSSGFAHHNVNAPAPPSTNIIPAAARRARARRSPKKKPARTAATTPAPARRSSKQPAAHSPPPAPPPAPARGPSKPPARPLATTPRPPQPLHTITVACVSSGKFKSGTSEYPITDRHFECTSNNDVTTLHSAADTRQLGYTIGNHFHQLIYLKCNAKDKRTIYTQHKIEPISFQQRIDKENFSTRFEPFDSTDASKGDYVHYTQNRQKEVICRRTLNWSNDRCNRMFKQDERFLSYGHLVPKGDFGYLAAKRATYSMLNAAPQWYQLNSGPWEIMESAVRNRCIERNQAVDVYTGTVGTLTLADNNNKPKPLFLDQTFGRIPVPNVFYKVVLDRDNRKGVVFLAHNNPGASYGDVLDAKRSVGCNDVADTLDWPQELWFTAGGRIDRETDVFRSKGYMWACAAGDFAKKIRMEATWNLPIVELMQWT